MFINRCKYLLSIYNLLICFFYVKCDTRRFQSGKKLFNGKKMFISINREFLATYVNAISFLLDDFSLQLGFTG